MSVTTECRWNELIVLMKLFIFEIMMFM